ncbi:MAG: ribokinase [Muribaculaceae bacterium]|nr:ribokinase [Muribaculaceae bacterium]
MKILNFGSLNIDKVYRVPHLAGGGETISSKAFQCFPGGKGLNQSVAAARAGAPVYQAGTIGGDGEFLIETLMQSGVDTCHIRRINGVSGHAVIQVADTGENCIVLFPGCNRENGREYMDRVLTDFAEGDILMLQNEINDLEYLLMRGREKGMRIMLNPSPVDEYMAGMDLSGVSWLILNETEGHCLTGERELEQIFDCLLGRYPGMQVILTLGSRGAIWGDREGRINRPAIPVRAADTTAAGDTFTGYFTAAMAQGLDPDRGMELATAAAAISVTAAGASVSIPERETVEAFMRGREV